MNASTVLLLLLGLDYYLILLSFLFVPYRVRTGSILGGMGLPALLVAAQAGLGYWIMGGIYTWDDPEWAILLYLMWFIFSGILFIYGLHKALRLDTIRRAGARELPFSYRWLGHIHLILTVFITILLFAGQYLQGFLPLVLALMLGGLAWAFYQQDKNYRRASIPEVLTNNARPVLYLRSFKTENIGFWAGRMGKVKDVTGTLGKSTPLQPFQSLTFAEYFGKAFSDRIGPFIMLGNPHDYLPLSGGYTDYYQDSNWQPHVLNYLERSAAIVMPVVQSANLDWELNRIRELGYAEKLFVLTAPVQNRVQNALSRFFMKLFGTLPIGWAQFRDQLKACGYELPETDPGAGAVLRFDAAGKAKVIFSDAERPEQYVDAVAKAFWG